MFQVNGPVTNLGKLRGHEPSRRWAFGLALQSDEATGLLYQEFDHFLWPKVPKFVIKPPTWNHGLDGLELLVIADPSSLPVCCVGKTDLRVRDQRFKCCWSGVWTQYRADLILHWSGIGDVGWMLGRENTFILLNCHVLCQTFSLQLMYFSCRFDEFMWNKDFIVYTEYEQWRMFDVFFAVYDHKHYHLMKQELMNRVVSLSTLIWGMI